MSTITQVKDTMDRLTTRRARWPWYQAIIFYAIIQVLTFGLAGLVSLANGNRGKSLQEDLFGNASYFNELNQSIFAPPSWAFGPAWLLNNISVLWGTWRVLNKPKNAAGRTSFLALQGASWVNFVVFNAAYFSLRSPINALLLTLSLLVLTLLSGFVAIFRLKDTKVALSLATLFIWLLIALTAAAFQAAWNYDDFYQVGPFQKVNASLLKKAE